jgi:tryptophan synthase alpha chain
MILPDLPLTDYVREYKPLFEQNGLSNIFLITPQTPEQRIREIDTHTNGFIYMVSTASVTGSTTGQSVVNTAYFERVSGLGLRNPGIIGFGIHNHDTFTQACNHASGAIIGSAFIKALAGKGNLSENISTFIQGIRKNQIA